MHSLKNDVRAKLTSRDFARNFIQLNGNSKSPNLDRCRILSGRQQDTVGFEVSVNDVIVMAVPEGLEHLTHVMAGRVQMVKQLVEKKTEGILYIYFICGKTKYHEAG